MSTEAQYRKHAITILNTFSLVLGMRGPSIVFSPQPILQSGFNVVFQKNYTFILMCGLNHRGRNIYKGYVSTVQKDKCRCYHNSASKLVYFYNFLRFQGGPTFSRGGGGGSPIANTY